MSNKHTWSVFLVAALLLAAMLPVMAQSIMATLSGTVADKSGAVVPGAAVVLKNANSGDVRRTQSNAEGFFSIAAVPAGTYSVSIQTSGFAPWERTGIQLNPGDKRSLSDIVLQITTSAESVVVSAEPAALAPVDSGELSAIVTNKQLQEISIVGRNATEFIKILPGMAIDTADLTNRPGFSGETVGINGSGVKGSQSAIGNFSANGSGNGGIDIVSDGTRTIDPGKNGGTPVNPNADMIQEIKVLSSNFGAENAKGPVVVTAISKAGGRDFHGGAYLYARHMALNANEWMNNRTAQYKNGKHIDNKTQDKYFFPGGNIGGPVLIPGTRFNKGRDKMFFFTGFEAYRQNLDTGVYRAFIPTADMMKGDFSPASLAKNGSRVPSSLNNGISYPGGIIPKTALDPGGMALAKNYPTPNVDPAGVGEGYNYIKAAQVSQNSWQLLNRVDYSVSDNTKIFVRYNLQKELQQAPMGLWTANTERTVPYPTNVLGKNISQSIAASVTHVFSPSLTNEANLGYTFVNFPYSLEDPKKVDRAALGYPYKGIFKNGSTIIPNLESWGTGIAAISNTGGFTPTLFATKYLPSFSDNVIKVAGTHTIKTGVYWEGTSNKQQGNGQDNGQFVYAPWESQTGNNYADIMTGGGWFNYIENTKNKSLHLGMQALEFYVQDSWKVAPRLTLEAGVRFQHMRPIFDRDGIGVAIFNPAKYSNNPADLDKRTGLLWTAKDSSVPASGFQTRALFYSPRFGFAWDVFGKGKTTIRGGFGVFRYYDGLVEMQGALDTASGGRNIQGDKWYFGGDGRNTFSFIENYMPTGGIGRTGATVVDGRDDRQPWTRSYSFTISQRLPKSLTWETAYVGSMSGDLRAIRTLNAVPFGALFADPNGARQANADNYRAMGNYQAITEYTHMLRSNYNAFQTSLTRQAGRVHTMVNYTFSKAMGHRGSNQNLQGLGEEASLRATWGPLRSDRTHIFNVSYALDLPGIQGNAFARALVNGWQISGISRFQSGVPLQAATNANFATGDGLGELGLQPRDITGSTEVGPFPRIVCDPRSNLAEGQYVNGACFAPPSQGRNGDYIWPYFKGPAFVNHDISLFKTFSFSERRNLQLRFSGFNFLNHPLVSFSPNDGNLYLSWNAAGKQSNSRFGFADTKYGHRVIQLAVKYNF